MFNHVSLRKKTDAFRLLQSVSLVVRRLRGDWQGAMCCHWRKDTKYFRSFLMLEHELKPKLQPASSYNQIKNWLLWYHTVTICLRLAVNPINSSLFSWITCCKTHKPDAYMITIILSNNEMCLQSDVTQTSSSKPDIRFSSKALGDSAKLSPTRQYICNHALSVGLLWYFKLLNLKTDIEFVFISRDWC